ncbi:MAG: Hsp20/alpha crystallin family protein [Candidatus Rickettsia vulgarisii]
MNSNLQLEKNRLVNNIFRNNYLDNIFNDFIKESSFFPSYASPHSDNNYLLPKIDMSEDNNKYHIDVELPGIQHKDISLKIDNNVLTIEGITQDSLEKKDKNYYLQERSYGSFRRSIRLPSNIDDNSVDARFENGILHIVLEKKEHSKVKHIEIKT